MADYTQEELLNAKQEVGREVGYRKYCYPKWIATGRITKEEADERYKNMQKAYEILKGLCEETEIKNV